MRTIVFCGDVGDFGTHRVVLSSKKKKFDGKRWLPQVLSSLRMFFVVGTKKRQPSEEIGFQMGWNLLQSRKQLKNTSRQTLSEDHHYSRMVYAWCSALNCTFRSISRKQHVSPRYVRRRGTVIRFNLREIPFMQCSAHGLSRLPQRRHRRRRRFIRMLVRPAVALLELQE